MKPVVIIVILTNCFVLSCTRNSVEKPGKNESHHEVEMEQPAKEKRLNRPISEKVDQRVEKFITISRKGDVKEVESLIQKGVDVNAFNSQGKTALMAAFLARRVDVSRLLLTKGADPKLKNTSAEDAVYYALLSAESKIIEMLEKRRIDLQKMDRKILIRISCFGDEDALRLLLVNKKRINYQDEYKETSLLHAARCGVLKNVKYLVESGADLNLTNDLGWTPLIVATMFGNVAVVRFLLEQKADTEVKDWRERSALDYAVEFNRKKIEKMMRRKVGGKKRR